MEKMMGAEARQTTARRKQKFLVTMENEARQREIIKKPLYCKPQDFVEGRPITPQQKVDNTVTEWTKWWCKKKPNWRENFEKATAWIPTEGYECPKLRVKAGSLWKIAKAKKAKAAGIDGWAPKDLARLPMG